MAIMVGSARQDERGKLSGGTAGDQTKKEVMQQTMYMHSKGWFILRPKTVELANKLAAAMITACNNENIGYDQNQRLGVISRGINTSVKTECDCSSLVRACCIAAGFDPGNFTTANESSYLYSSGKFEKNFAYVDQKTTPVYNGDVLVTKTKGHTVIVTSGSPRPAAVDTSKYYPKYTGSSVSIVTALSAVGEKDTSFNHRNKIAVVNGVVGYSGTADQNTKLVGLLKQGKLLKA